MITLITNFLYIMRNIILTIVAVMAFCFVNNSVYASNADDFKVNKVEYVEYYEEFIDTVYHVSINNIEYKISSLFSTESVDVLKKANKIYAVTLFKEGEDLGNGDWSNITRLPNGNYFVWPCGSDKSVEINVQTDETKPYEFSDALNIAKDPNDWYEFNVMGRGYCYADRINPVKGNHAFTILIYE